jgi:hypothetical protein
MPGRPVSVADDGVLEVATPQTRFSAVVPAALRDEGVLLPDGSYVFVRSASPLHTVSVLVNGTVVDPGRWPDFRSQMAGSTEAVVLADYLTAVEPLERASPGRPTNTLLSFERVGGARPPQAARNLACSERALVALDHEVPGQAGRPFVYHARYYTCVDPHTRAPVELAWSERLPEDPDGTAPGFMAEADAFFDSLRFLEPR